MITKTETIDLANICNGAALARGGERDKKGYQGYP